MKLNRNIFLFLLASASIYFPMRNIIANSDRNTGTLCAVFEEGVLCISNPKMLGIPTSPVILEKGILQVNETLSFPNPIVVKEKNILDIPSGVIVKTTGDISGEGSICKTSKGVWDHYGDCIGTVDIDIVEGSLHAHGILSSKNIEIHPSASFESCATSGDNIRNDGLIKSCPHIGSLIINGNYTQTSNGTVYIRCSPSGTCDTIHIKGAASLDGFLHFDLLPGIYSIKNSYNFLQANTLKGYFTKLLSNKLEAGVITYETDGVTLTVCAPQIILPIENEKLPNNPKHVANYLFTDEFPFENKEFVDLLQNLFIVPIREYESALASLTPEIYGALPLTQNQTIYHLTNSSPPYTLAKNIFCVTPFYQTSYYDKEKLLSNYQYNTIGFSINASQYTEIFTPGTGLTYCRTDTVWQNKKGQATTFNIYLYPYLTFHNESLFCNVTVLGGYTCHNVTRSLQFANYRQMNSTPHSWELASTLCGGYTCNTKFLTFIPQLNFTQINIFQSAIKEDKTVDASLKTSSKNFRYLNMSLSLRIEKAMIYTCCSLTPSLQFGWHKSRLLSDKNFNSKLKGYILRKKDFRTETYSGNMNLYFLQGAVALSRKDNNSLELAYKAEFDTKVRTSGLSVKILWDF